MQISGKRLQTTTRNYWLTVRALEMTVYQLNLSKSGSESNKQSYLFQIKL